jgi:glycosyltransferase involved in cell wall biosynthesis
MNAQPLASVVIPTYNSAETVVRAIESALAQTYKPIEIVIVDDCSSDGTKAIVDTYADRGVRFMVLPEHGGASVARNAGIDAAKGELIAFLDSDDEWLSTKLERQIALMLSDPRLTLVFCLSNLISPNGTDVGDIFHGRKPATGVDAWKALLAANFITTPGVLVRRKDIKALGGFDPKLRIGEDQDMWIRLALRGHLGCVEESLVRVHARTESLSNSAFRDQLVYTLPMIEGHLAALKDRLKPSEMRQIKGERLGRLGRAAYTYGLTREGFRMIVQSMTLGYKPLEGAFHLVASAPSARWLKRKIRRQ